MNIEERIRMGIIIKQPGTETYRGVFIGKNFYLYRLVEKQFGFRGDNFNDDAYVVVYSDIQYPQEEVPPLIVPVRGR